MARIRTIKPEFPQSETIGRLSRDARLLFIQLWTIADDAGRMRGASRMIASLLYPYDDDAGKLIGKWLEELESKGCIQRYDVDGSSYVQIVNWLKHQKIDRPSESRLPSIDERSCHTREESRASDADLGPSTSTLDRGPPAPTGPRAEKKRATQYPENFSPDLERALAAGLSDAEAAREAQKFKNYAQANAKTYVDWQAAWRNWCLKSAEYLGRSPRATDPPSTAIPDESYLERFKRGTVKWNPGFGPEPNQPGCRVPRELLIKHGYIEAA